MCIRDRFKGFDDIYSRVKLAFNFDAVGGTGALIMSEVTLSLIHIYKGVLYAA